MPDSPCRARKAQLGHVWPQAVGSMARPANRSCERREGCVEPRRASHLDSTGQRGQPEAVVVDRTGGEHPTKNDPPNGHGPNDSCWDRPEWGAPISAITRGTRGVLRSGVPPPLVVTTRRLPKKRPREGEGQGPTERSHPQTGGERYGSRVQFEPKRRQLGARAGCEPAREGA